MENNERKLSTDKEDLLHSEEKYRILFDSMDEGYCIIQMIYDHDNAATDWRYLLVNRAFELNNGLHDAEGKTIREMAPDIESKWIRIYDQVAQSGVPLRFEEDSEALKRIFSLYAFRIGIPEERKVAVIFTDITARKRAEEALRASEKRLKELNENLEQLIETRTQELLRLKDQRDSEILNAMIVAQEEERARISEGLHDGVAQLLYAVQNRLGLVMPAGEKDQEELGIAHKILVEAIQDTRKISFELLPPVLKDHGLEVSLKILVDRIATDRFHINLETDLPVRFPEMLEISIYRIAQEILNNMIKHSKASKALLSIYVSDEHIHLMAYDNGIGFDLKSESTIHGIGLQNIRNRVKLMNGKLMLHSGQGKGTSIDVKIQLRRDLNYSS